MPSSAASSQASRLALAVDRARARRVVTRTSEPGSEYIARGTVLIFRVLAVVCAGTLFASLYFLATWTPVLMVVSFLLSRFLLWIWEVVATRLVRLIASRDQGFLAVGLQSRLLSMEPGQAVQEQAGPETLVTLTLTMPEKLVPVLIELAERWGLKLHRDHEGRGAGTHEVGGEPGNPPRRVGDREADQ